MKVCLHDFRGTDGWVKPVQAREEWDGLEFQGQEIGFPGGVTLDLLLESHGSELQLTGTVSTVLSLVCSRCAERFEHPVRISVADRIPLNRSDDPEEQWGSSYLDSERDEFDLSEYALLLLLERLPLQPLCQADCRGLCPVCGQNLNQATCDCRTEASDPRLAVLAKLLKPER